MSRASRRHLLAKAQHILTAILPGWVRAAEIPGVSDRHLTARVGIDAASTFSIPVDTIPRVDLFVSSSVTDDETIGETRIEWVVHIASLTQHDGGTQSDAARAASDLADAVADCLVRYLPDPPDMPGPVSIWQVDHSNPATEQATQVHPELAHTMRAVASILVSTAARYEREPTYLDAPLLPSGRAPLQARADLPVSIDGTPVASLPHSEVMEVAITPGDAAAASAVLFDLAAAYPPSPGDVWSVYTRLPPDVVSGTHADPVTVPGPIQLGDMWHVHLQARNGRTLTWTIKWT